ncbi:MAG: hypothetical protein NZ930_01300 [Candidatus Bipolaricaulota bacterium]|nr:hypothetical protein [Candidatus Bipolaricaulota bacterium]MDW8031337.1 hypothetical protein [Candidatus Bipolaricaulota bacterium]
MKIDVKGVVAGLALGVAVSITGMALTSGNPETMVIRDFSGSTEPFAAPGQTFVVAGALRVYDPGGDNAPTAIETISLCLAPTSTLTSRYIAGLRLYLDNSLSGAFDRRESSLVGSVVRPQLDDCENPLVFGQPGSLFALVPNGGARLFFVVIDLASEAPDGATLGFLVDMTASDGLRGGPAISSGFSVDQGPPVLTDTITVRATSGDAETDIVDETPALTARPGTSVVVQQFVIADPGSDGDTEDDELATLVRSITVQAVPSATTIDLSPSVGLIQRIRLFRENGRTGPGWQERDELLGEVLRPDLRAGVTFGSGGRRLVRVGRNNIFGTGGVERFYIVVDLAPSGFAHAPAENLLRTQITVVARDDGSEDGEESSGIETSMPVIAHNAIKIETVNPGGGAGSARLIVGDVSMVRQGKLVLRVAGVPWPGLGDVEARLTFDSRVIQVREDPTSSDEQRRYKVRALGSYMLDELEVDNELGELSFVVSLKPGRKAITDGDILEIEIIPGNDVRLCMATDVEIAADSVVMANAHGDPIDPNVEMGLVRLELKPGDVNLDGVLNRRDMRAATRLVGKTLADFTADEREMRRLQLMAADVAPPFGEVTATDVRWIKEAIFKLRTLPGSACDNTAWQATALSRPSQPFALSGVSSRMRGANVEFAVQGAGIAETTVELFTLMGTRLLTATAPGTHVTLRLVNDQGRALAKGVYLYVVTVRGWDGTIIASEVRKLVVMR